ncbi:MAG: hypothetical protein ACI9JL_001109 [Paracoccaceae bacterium]|jgi:hypothetical protein
MRAIKSKRPSILKPFVSVVLIALGLTVGVSVQAHPPGHAYGWCKNHSGCNTPTNTHIGSTITSGHASVALPKPTPIIVVPPLPVMAIPKPAQFAVPKPLRVVVPPLKPGFVDYPKYQGLRDPHTGYPMPTLPVARYPLPKPIVPPPVIAGNIPPQMKPGFTQFPNYTGPRNPANGYPVPPQVPTLTPNPQPGQAPPKVPSVIAGNIPPQMKPGFMQFPNYTGPRNPANGYPVPPQVPTLTPNPQPGQAPPKVPSVIAGNIPPQMKPGFTQFPNYTGPRNPANGYPIPPQAPALTPNPQLGQAPARVPPVIAGNIPPQMKPGFTQFPNYTGPRNPANRYPIPSQVPPVIAGNIPPQMKPGFAQFPNYAGPRNPANGYPVPQQVPPQIAGNTTPKMLPGYVKFPNYVGPRNPITGYPMPVSSGSLDREKAAQQARMPRDPPAVADYGLDFRVIGIALPRF